MESLVARSGDAEGTAGRRAFGSRPALRLGLTAAVLALAGAASALAQTAAAPERIASAAESASLPDAPQPAVVEGATRQGAAGPGLAQTPRPGSRVHGVAGEFDKFVEAGEIAPHLSVGDKILMGMRGSVSPYALIGWVSSATYSEAIDGSPYYGQNGKDYLQRLGAASAKATSEDIFTVSVLSPALHEDPRYFQMGSGHNFFARFGYSVTRVLVTKKDGGESTVNYAVLGGNLAGSALTQAYYPPGSRGFGEVMKTFGTSLLGQAVGNVFDEFILSSAEFLQLKKRF